MQETAKRISKLWHDRPLSVMDSAIYWVEYVARHREAPAPLPSQRASWFESLKLDVAALLILLAFVICFLFYVIFKLVVVVIKTIIVLFVKKLY